MISTGNAINLTKRVEFISKINRGLPPTMNPLSEDVVTRPRYEFDPYIQNGGSSVGTFTSGQEMIDCSAIAGLHCVVMAGDTRLTDGGHAIESRFVPTIHKLDDRVLVSGGGCQSDTITFTQRLAQQMEVHSQKYPGS